MDSIKALHRVDSLIKCSRSLVNEQKFDKALFNIKLAKNVVILNFGPDHLINANCLINHGRILSFMERYNQAEREYLQAKELIKRVNGSKNTDYINCLSSLANVYSEMGRYQDADILYSESKNLIVYLSGTESKDYAGCISDQAALYFQMGKYNDAEPLFLEAKSIWENKLGKNQDGYVKCLNNLAVLYQKMGRFEAAGNLYLEAITIRKNISGTANLDYAQSLNNLGVFQMKMNKFSLAEPLFIESQSIYGMLLGKASPKYSSTLNQRATLNFNLKRFKQAEALYLEVINIRLKHLGEEHPDYATSLNNLANLYHSTERFSEAEQLYLEARCIRENVFGKKHPDYASVISNLAALYERQNRFSESEPLLKELVELNQNALKKAVSYLSEQELAQYIKTFQLFDNNLLGYLMLRVSKFKDPGILASLCYQNALFNKGFLLTSSNEIRKYVNANSTIKEINNQLKACGRILAKQYSLPILNRNQQIVDSIETEVNIREKALVKNSAGYKEAIVQVTWQDVRSQLFDDEAAIEFVHFPDPKDKNLMFYAALVLRNGSQNPEFIRLCETKDLEGLLNASSLHKLDYVSNLYQPTIESSQLIDKLSNVNLYDLIWKPLENKLSRVKIIYFSTAGLLHRISHQSISIDGKSFLTDHYNLVQLGSTRQILFLKYVTNENLNSFDNPYLKASLFGAINFDLDTSGTIPIFQERNIDSLLNRSEYNLFCADTTINDMPWKYLYGSELELSGIEKILFSAGLSTDVFIGNDASEESFKKIGNEISISPNLIHLSTHGYFYNDPNDENQVTTNDFNSEPIFKISSNPMIRSGIILAGANQAWKNGKPFRPNMEDGILTAYEISQLNLKNTELVVLSACETGLGDIQGNEGVYGLQRAFKIAGVKHLIMSLWQVPDKETADLMISFYNNWLLEKMNIHEALHSAQLEMRNREKSVYYWGGFVLVE